MGQCPPAFHSKHLQPVDPVPLLPTPALLPAQVVDAVAVPSDISGKQAVYCRCWRSDTFPLCNGAHVKHNAATGNNVGPLILKKDE